MRTSRLRYLLASLTLASVAAHAAHADQMLTVNVPSGTEAFSFSDGTGSAGTNQFSALDGFHGYAGPLSSHFAGGKSFTTYCVDLFKEISSGSTYGVNPADPATLAGHDMIGALLAHSPSRPTPAQGAALQFAIWDAEYLGGHDVVQDGEGVRFGTAGSGFSVTGPGTDDGSFASLVNGDLLAASGRGVQGNTGPEIAFSYLDVSDGEHGQSMVAAVPEPATLTLAVIGLVGFVAVRCRRVRSGKPTR